MSRGPRNNAVPVVTGQFDWHGYRLGYEVWGDRGVPCLLMHGLLLDSLMNRDLARRFVAEGYRVVLLDFLGHGRSDKPTDAREHRLDYLAQQAVACLDHLNIDKALIGGCSLGANTSLEIAVSAPERCLGLFIEMPVMEWSAIFAGVMFLPAVAATDYLKWLVRPFSLGMWRLPRPRWETGASVLNAMSAEPAVINAVLHGYFVGGGVPNVHQRRAITVPSLVVGHAGDRLHEMRDAVALARELPAGQLVKARSIFELRTRPGRLWPPISSFLGRIRQQATADDAQSQERRTGE